MRIGLSYFRAMRPQKFSLMVLIGFSSGLPLLLTSSTLSFWLNTQGISLTHIGLFGMIVLPYSLKFLWAPFVDQWNIPVLTRIFGHRRSWLLLSQCCIIILLCCIGLQKPENGLIPISILGFMLSFVAATQDMVLLAYQADTLEEKHYGIAEATTIFGYRIGLLTSGAGALYLTDVFAWGEVYWIMAGLMSIGILTTLWMTEPARRHITKQPAAAQTIRAIMHSRILQPFSSFCRQKGWLPILLLMAHYKLGDNLIGSLSAIFYHDLGFSSLDIANASKVFGMWATIIGGFIGGGMLMRIGLLPSLFWFALIHGASMLMYVYLAHVGYDTTALYTAIALENITGGMRTTALLAFRFAVVDGRSNVTHMALLTSCIHLGRFIYATPSGAIVDAIGWKPFFYLVTASTLPVLGLIYWVKKAWIPPCKIEPKRVNISDDCKTHLY